MRFVRLLSKSPAARAFSFSFLILLKHFSAELKHFSAEWLEPSQKVHIYGREFLSHYFYYNLICCQDLDSQSEKTK